MPLLRLSATLLIGGTCMGSGIALAAAREALLRQAEPLSPATSSPQLLAVRYRSIDPQRRREAALLLSALPASKSQERQKLLMGQGWGHSHLAAVSLKLAALNAAANQQSQRAALLWQTLLERFPAEPASADALYALGRQKPAHRTLLLQRFPAHPAALAAALEADNSLHLARWGARWPGAEALLLASCTAQAAARRPAPEREQLAAGLLQLGHPRSAEQCMAGETMPAALELQLSRNLLRGNRSDAKEGEERLLALARNHSTTDLGRAAADTLAEEPSAAPLRLLPPALRETPAVQARLALEGQVAWRTVLERWPKQPSSWELQWQLARNALLHRHWSAAETMLSQISAQKLPAPLAARQLFWLGYSAKQQGRNAEANKAWQQLLQTQPVGYYSWRALLRLQSPLAALEGSEQPVQPPPWQPLGSGHNIVDSLWRTGQQLEAWETWRHLQQGREPSSAPEMLVEGRLRTGVRDDWNGLRQLELANLRLPQASCQVQWQREQQQHPRRFAKELGEAAQQEQVDIALLWGVGRQESRFSPHVGSSAGAIGLLQLMPATASELAGAEQRAEALRNPAHNARLGARYLRQLLEQWQQHPFLAVASYNAGPGAVASWRSAAFPDPQQEPELWAEAIPYPETRLYVKKVLGNLWSYRLLQLQPEAICQSR